jgi:hypothetical protein
VNCLTTHKGYQSQTSMSPAGFETPSPSKRATTDPRLRRHFSTYISYAYMCQDRHGVCKKLHWQIRKSNAKEFPKALQFSWSLGPCYTVTSQGSYFTTKTGNIRNNEAPSCNHCCENQWVSHKLSACTCSLMYPARQCACATSSVVCPALQHFHIIS